MQYQIAENKPLKPWHLFLTTLGLAIGGALITANAVETAGVQGSPSATTTLDGKQLPPPPDTMFGGKIERNAIDSKPYCPPRVVPPK